MRRLTPVYVVVAAADTALAATGRDEQRRVTKPLLMPLLSAGRDRATRRALTLGWIGDVALLGSRPTSFAGVRLPAHEGLVMATHTTAQGLLARLGSPPG